MKTTLLVLVLIFMVTAHLSAQYYTNQNKVWVFGTHAGVDFNTGSPVAIPTNINQVEGCASVSNAMGSLLFYTDGKTVYNNTGAIMPSGGSIVSYQVISATQAALIVPVPGNATQYYLFSLEQYNGPGGYCHLSYSIVDMSLAGGLGDVVSTSTGVPMAMDLSEKMTAIPGNSCNVWLLTHLKDDPVFWAYNITAAGITGPVVSSAGSISAPDAYAIGVIKASPNRQKIVSQCWTTAHGTELYDFNPSTGVVSNCQALDHLTTEYGAEFSPDNTKLYAEQFSDIIYQYDLSLPTTAAIVASKTVVATGGPWGDLKLGADNKIYVSRQGSGYLDCFTSPDLPGTVCGFTSDAVALFPGTTGVIGLPNIVIALAPADTSYMHNDTTACTIAGDSIMITAYDTGTGTGSGYLWNDSVTTLTQNITQPGSYWVRVSTGCNLLIDTINVTGFDTAHIHQDTTACIAGDNDLVTLTAQGGTNFLWYNGDTTLTSIVNSSGNYWVTCRDGCTIKADTIHIVFNQVPIPISGPDTVCIGDTTQLTDATGGGAWQSSAPGISVIGSVTGKVVGIAPGTATITYTVSTGCAVAKTIMISTLPCTTGIDETVSDYRGSVEVYPDPVAGELSIKMDLDAFNSFTITNGVGQVIMQQPISTTETKVDVTILPSGLYYISFRGNNGIKVRKFVKR